MCATSLCAAVRNRIAKQTRGLLNPKGLPLQYWDFMTTFALLYTLFVTPFEVGLDLPTKMDALLVANQVIAIIFLIDIVVQFFLPTPVGDQGLYERLHWNLAKNYIMGGWFFLDVLTIVPWDIMVWVGILNSGTKSMKLLRILRLVKLVKVLKASRIIQRWDNRFGIKSSSKTLFGYFSLMMVLLHLFSCGWCLLPVLTGGQRQDVGTADTLALESALLLQVEIDPDCSDRDVCFASQLDHDNSGSISEIEAAHDPAMAALCNSQCLSECELKALASIKGWNYEHTFMNEPWMCRAVTRGFLTPDFARNPTEVYFSALLVSLLQMVGGVSTVLPMNHVENVWFVCVILVGTVLFAAIQGIICGVVTNGDPDETEWMQKNDRLNAMMADTKVPQEDRMKVRSHFRRAKRLFKRQSYDSLMTETLTQELRGDVRYYMCQTLFSHVWYLSECSRSFLEDLSVKLTRESYAPDEPIECEEKLVIVTAGMAVRSGAFLGSPSTFGDVLVNSNALRDTTPAKAVTYCEVAKLSRADLYEVLEVYPDDAKSVKQASIKLALQRAILVVSVYAKIQQAKGMTDKLEPSDVLKQMFGSQDWNEVEFDEEGKMKIVGMSGIHSESAYKEPTAAELVGSLEKKVEDPQTQTLVLLRMILERQDGMQRSITTLERVNNMKGNRAPSPPLAVPRAVNPAGGETGIVGAAWNSVLSMRGGASMDA